MAETLLDKGLVPMANGWRGYFLSACLSIGVLIGRFLDAIFNFTDVSGGYIGFRIFSSIGYAVFFACLLPGFFLRFFGGHDGLLRRLLPLALTITCWPGLLLYPLSDVCGVAFFILFLWSLDAWYDVDQLWRGAVYMLLAGAAGYACYNTRLVYQYPIAISMIFPLIVWVRGFMDPHKATLTWLRRTVLHLIAFALGFLLIAVPQMYANKINFNTWSFQVVGFRKGVPNLELVGLQKGMIGQVYFANNDSKAGKVGGLYILDEAGTQLAAQWSDTSSTKGFFKLIFSKPLDFVGIYGRHLVHNMDIFTGETYFSYPFPYQYLKTFLGYTVFFIAAFVLITARQVGEGTQFFWHSRLRWCLLFLPALQILPMSVEARYFYPVHLALFCGMAYLFDRQRHFKVLREHWFTVTILYVVSIAVFMGVTTAAFV
jgi:hypothetical protein